MNMRCTPQRVLEAHAPDQGPQLLLRSAVGHPDFSTSTASTGWRASWPRGAIIWVGASTRAYCGAQKRTFFILFCFFFTLREA
jgi:hypothetical protein